MRGGSPGAAPRPMQPRIPSPVPGVNVTSLPLGTLEGFVLSRVDGATTVDDIAMMSGIELPRLLSILERLAELGAVELSWKASTRPRYEPWEIEERNVDLPMEVRKRILEAYYASEDKDHYALLGVPRTAKAREVRMAYFELARHFHPDSQFGKRLGGFGKKMETVFRRLTTAYEVLGRPKHRAEYDEYLAASEATDETRQALEQVELAFEQLRHGEIPAGSEAPERDLGSTPARPPASTPVRADAPARTREDEAKRRERATQRLRQRLKATSDAPAQKTPAAPPRTPAALRGAGTGGSLPGTRVRTPPKLSTSERIAEHIVAANRAERAGDLLAAANELQLAMALDPSRDDLQRDYARVRETVSLNLADNYEKQARYEEKTGKWEAAGESWAHVSDARPRDPSAARAAAEAMLKARADLHRAQRYAQKAVRADPNDVASLRVLARVYLEAGLRMNALRELEKAAKLDPTDEMVKNLLREAK